MFWVKKLTQNLEYFYKTMVGMFLWKYMESKEKKQYKVLKWYSTLWEGLIKLCLELTDYNSKWGQSPPSKRVNVCQAPLPFSINRSTTYEEEIAKEMRKYYIKFGWPILAQVWKKRQYSVLRAFTPEDNNVRVAIVFCGNSKKISDDEINCYHKSVNKYWQQSG